MADHLTQVSGSLATLLARDDLTDPEWRELLAVQATVAVAEQLAAILAELRMSRVTEHTAPASRLTDANVHPYFESDPSRDSCGQWLGAPPALCGRRRDAEVHQVEDGLDATERDVLEFVAGIGPADLRRWDEAAARRLVDRGFLEPTGQIRAPVAAKRGWAWLEAHPRLGGDPR
jgi:hypothetical protein